MFNTKRRQSARGVGAGRRAARGFGLIALAISLAVVAAACGSTSSSSTSTTKAATSSTSTTGKTTKGSTTLIAKYTADIAKYLTKPAYKDPGPSLNASTLKGKTILAIINDEKSVALTDNLKGVEAAGAAAGFTVTPFDATAQVTNVAKAFTEGISQHVAAIVTIGIESDLITASLTAAKKANIPVVALSGQFPNPSATGQGGGPNVFGAASFNYAEIAKITAEAAIVGTNGQAKVAILGFPNNAISAGEMTIFKSTLSTCSGCSVLKTDTVLPTKWPTTIPTVTESLVREFPTMNTIITTADTIALFAASGIKTAGATGKVHVYTLDGTPGAVLKLVQTGSIVVADPGGSGQWVGWSAVDQVLRALLNMKPATPFVPFRFLSASNLKGKNATSGTTLYGTGYVTGFKKLWGV